MNRRIETDMTAMALVMTDREEKRFWSNVDKQGAGDCWNWNAYIGKGESPRFYLRGGKESAPRIAYMLTYGYVPRGKHVLRNCGSNSCCNPTHLRIVPPKVRKGYNRKGANGPNSKLNDDSVRAIRALAATGKWEQKQLANVFAVSVSSISHIVTRRQWTHI